MDRTSVNWTSLKNVSTPGVSEVRRCDGSPEDQEQGTQDRSSHRQSRLKLFPAAASAVFDAVAVAGIEVVAIRAVVFLEMFNDGLDGSSSSHRAADGVGDAPHLA